MRTTYINTNGIIIYVKEDNNKVIEVGRDFDLSKHSIERTSTSQSTSQIAQYLQGRRNVFDFEYNQTGTPFQKSVWEVLTKIPYGETWTYKQVAQELGDEKKVRAVANAIGKNKLMVIIPCHRVIGSDGKLHGFAGGLDMKQHLINIEKENKHGFEK